MGPLGRFEAQLPFYYNTFRHRLQEANAKVTKFPRLEQNIFITFVHFEYCNFFENVIYYSHIKEVQSDGKVR